MLDIQDVIKVDTQHTLAVRGGYDLENTANGKTVMREVKTLWGKWEPKTHET
jgi:hypothetical protein